MAKKANVVLSFEERNHFAAFFVLLVHVEKRSKEATPVKKTKKAKSKSSRKTKLNIGSFHHEPFLLPDFCYLFTKLSLTSKFK